MDRIKVVNVIQDHPPIHPHTGLAPYTSTDTPIYLSPRPSTIHPPTNIYPPIQISAHPPIYTSTLTYLPLGLPHSPVHQPTHPLIYHPCTYINISSVTIECVTGLFKAPLEMK